MAKRVFNTKVRVGEKVKRNVQKIYKERRRKDEIKTVRQRKMN